MRNSSFDDNRDEEENAAETRRESVAAIELGQIDPRDLSASVPVRWRDFAPSERPYGNPQDEYVRSPYPVSFRMLRQRWKGLISDSILRDLRENEAWKAERFRYQDEVTKQSFSTSLAGDVEWQRRRIDKEIIDIVTLIEQVQTNLNEGVEYAPSRSAGPLGYVQRPLTVDSLKKLGELRVALSDCLARRMGLATEVNVTLRPEESLEARMARVMMSNNPDIARLKDLAEGALPRNALPATQGATREIDVREREYSQLIEVMPIDREEQS